jgi:hypothetical protein
MPAESGVAMVACPLTSIAVAARAQASRTSIETPVEPTDEQAESTSDNSMIPKTDNLLINLPSKKVFIEKIITNIGHKTDQENPGQIEKQDVK